MSEQLTIRVADKDAVLRWIKRQELEHDVIYNAHQWQIYEAIVMTAKQNKSDLLDNLREIRDDTE